MPESIEKLNETLKFEELFSKAAAEPRPQAKVPPGYTGKDFQYQDRTYEKNKDGQIQSLNKDVTKMRWGMAKAFAMHTVNQNIAAASDGNLAVVRDYEWMEVLNPHHRFADLTKSLYEYYKGFFTPEYYDKISHFFWWMTTACKVAPNAVRNLLQSVNPPEQWPLIENFLEGGVAYLNKQQRKEFMLTFRGGRLLQGKAPFDTRQNSTFHSGAGWAIYVVSPRGQWFAGSHKAANFHHSSFLAGGMVIAAGEIQAHDGVPLVLSAKSGHYTPTMAQFLNGVASLKNAGVDLKKCDLSLYEKGKEVNVNALAALNDAQLGAKYTVWG